MWRDVTSKNPWFSSVIVALGIACAEFSTNVTAFLLPTLEEFFSLSDHSVSLAVSVGLCGVGLSGLVYGISSDLLGRRKLYLVSLIIYFLGTLGMVYAKAFNFFLLARFLQGLGSGSAWVVGTALLRDQAQSDRYRQQISFLHVASGFVRGICPILGATLLLWSGWHASYWFLLGLASLTWCLFFLFQPETIQPTRPTRQVMLARWTALYQSQQFKQYLTIKVLSVVAIFIMLSRLPLILYDSHVPSFVAGELQGLMFFCFMLGTFLSERFVRYYTLLQVISAALWLVLLATSMLILLSESLPFALDIVVVACCFFAWGMIFANATSQVVGAIPIAAGLASSLMMFLEMVMGALGVMIVNYALEVNWVNTAIPVLCLSIFALWFGCRQPVESVEA